MDLIRPTFSATAASRHSSMTELYALPIDVLRPVLYYLPADDLTRLFCTFDRRMMKVMSFPGAIPRLHLEPCVSHVSPALEQYFVSHVRNVTQLSIVNWIGSTDMETLLSALNPVRLVLDFLQKTSQEFPLDLARLTPRLEALKLHTKAHHIAILLPPTLTSLRGFVNLAMPSLPHGLRSLAVDQISLELNEVFLRFPALEKLDVLHCISVALKESIVFPETLTHLKANSRCTQLVSRLPRSILRLDWDNMKEAPSTWPIGLRVLNLSDLRDARYLTGLSSLQTLEFLSVKGPLSINADTEISASSSHIYLATLPSSLKSIVADCQGFVMPYKATSITPKMAALTTLIAYRFRIDQLEMFRKQAPHCTVYLETYTIHTSSLIGIIFAESGMPPSEAFNVYAKAVTSLSPSRGACAKLRMRCACVQRLPDGSTRPFVRSAFIVGRHLWIDLTSMAEHDHTLHTCSHAESFEIHGLKPSNTFLVPPHLMTRLDLSTLIGAVDLDSLPTTLTSLSSRAAANVYKAKLQDRWSPACLTHLDTPYWQFQAAQLGNLRGLQVFNATIDDLADYNVIDFLTIAVTPKTRRNMRIGIICYVTGAVVPEDDIDGLKDVTWSSICASTLIFLKRALAAPMPSTSLEDTLSDGKGHALHDSIDNFDTIGRVVMSLDISRDARSTTSVCIPSSATRVHLADQCHLNLFPNWRHIQPKAYGMRPEIKILSVSKQSSLFGIDGPSRSQKLPLFPRGDLLTRMTLLDVSSRPLWVNQLPSSLRYLHLSCRSISDQDFNVTFPPQLEVLILGASTAPDRPVVSFSGFPSTLRKLAILLDYWIVSDPMPSHFVLPDLNTVLFGDMIGSVLLGVWSRLSKSPLERFEVGIASGITSTRLLDYGITTTSSIDLKELTDQDCDTPQPGPSRPKISISSPPPPAELPEPSTLFGMQAFVISASTSDTALSAEDQSCS